MSDQLSLFLEEYTKSELKRLEPVIKRKGIENRWYKALPLIVRSDKSAEVTLLQPQPAVMYLHHVNLGDGRRNEACEGKGCFYCGEGNKRKKRYLYTVIDHRVATFKSKDGKPVREQHTLRYLDLNGRENSKLQEVAKVQCSKSQRYITLRVYKSDGSFAPHSFEATPRYPELHRIPPGAQPLDFKDVFDHEWRIKRGKPH